MALVVLTLILIVIATHPWPESVAAANPRQHALEQREIRLKHQAQMVERTLKRRWRAYELRLRARQRVIADAQRRYESQLAAARWAAAERARVLAAAAQVNAANETKRSVAQETPARTQAVSASAPASPVVKVVTLPPQVTVVTLPPVTVSTTS